MRLPSGVRKRGASLEKRFTVGGKQYSVSAKSITELIEKEVTRRAEIKSNLYSENKDVTLDEYFNEWISDKEKTVKHGTVTSYRMEYKHISLLLGDMKIRNIEVRHIKKMISTLQKQGASVIKCNKCLLVIRMILKSCMYERIINENPAQYVRRLKDDNVKKAVETIHRGLTEAEQETFIKAAKNNYYYELFAFLLLTGVRIGEAAALTWGDVDRFSNVIHINKTIYPKNGGGYVIQSPKTKSSKRDIPITDSIKGILQKAKEKAVIISGTENLPVDDRIFKTPFSNRVTSNQANFNIKKILKQIKGEGKHIEYFSVHALRDTFATRFIEQGGNPQTLKTLLGHSSLSMTMDLYSHVLPNTKQKEMENMRMIL